MSFNPPPEDSDRQNLISRMLARVRCAVCGRPFAPHDCTTVEKRPDGWVVGVSCRRCGTLGYVVVMIESAREPAPTTEQSPEEQAAARQQPPISGDELIDLHFYLDSFEGDMNALLSH